MGLLGLLLIVFLIFVRFTVARALFSNNKVSDDERAYQLAVYHVGYQDFLRGHHQRVWEFHRAKNAAERQKTDTLIAYYNRGYWDADAKRPNEALTQACTPALRDLFQRHFEHLQDLLLNAP